MIRALKTLLRGAAPSSEKTETGPREAAAALLVETAMADHIYDDVERAHIMEALRSTFAIGAEDARALLDKGEDLARHAVDHYRFTRVVKEQMTLEEREMLVEQLWRVAIADGARNAAEESFIRRLCPLLAVDDRARVLARQRAEAALRGGQEGGTPD